MDKISNIFIISYMPDDKNIRDKRLCYHNYQIDYLKSLKDYQNGTLKINVLAMNYPDNYQFDTSINYVTSSRIIASEARNYWLNIFYNSNDDYALFLDDDCMPVVYSGLDINRLCDACISKYEFDAMIGCGTFGKPQAAKEEYVCMILTNTLTGNCFVLKNYFKYYSYKLYFDREVTVLEDYAFATLLLASRLSLYKCTDIQTMGAISNASTIYGPGKDRKIQNAKAQEFILQRYKNLWPNCDIDSNVKMKNRLKKLKQYTNHILSYDELEQYR